jgi:hypothetical protein
VPPQVLVDLSLKRLLIDSFVLDLLAVAKHGQLHQGEPQTEDIFLEWIVVALWYPRGGSIVVTSSSPPGRWLSAAGRG